MQCHKSVILFCTILASKAKVSPVPLDVGGNVIHTMPPAPSSSPDFFDGRVQHRFRHPQIAVALDLAKILLGDQERGGGRAPSGKDDILAPNRGDTESFDLNYVVRALVGIMLLSGVYLV